ncbi:MAG: hypothetical protein GVY18_05185 [Bacteroidetes bacterium]|jgi:Ca2+/H+ antiporter|nr:hypothetical protein [Bacteroidota bacterium]
MNARIFVGALVALVLVSAIAIPTLDRVSDGWPAVLAFAGLVVLAVVFWTGAVYVMDRQGWL